MGGLSVALPFLFSREPLPLVLPWVATEEPHPLWASRWL